MATRVLDTNILINHWRRHFSQINRKQINRDDAKECGRSLIKHQGSHAILTPIYLEFICGMNSAAEVDLARHYLGQFKIMDGGLIQRTDWETAKNYAARVPRGGSRRQMGDCLIRAVCDRLRLDILTADRGFPPRSNVS
jgi:predicted nucleic acid-binding protein